MRSADLLPYLALFERAESASSLSWKVEGSDVRLFVNVSSMFTDGVEDEEEIKSGDLFLLTKCYEDLVVLDNDGSGRWQGAAHIWMGELMAARKRRVPLAPHAAQSLDPALRELFDEVAA